MGKNIRFLLRFAWVHLGSLVVFAVLVVAGCYATGVPDGADNLFRNYFTVMPLMAVFILFICGFALCTSSLNLALSMGARRKDFFWAVQATMFLYTAVSWGAAWAISALPRLENWVQPGRFLAASAWTSGAVFPMVCFASLVLGCLSGLVTAHSRGWGVAIMLVACLILMLGTVLMMLFGDADLWSFLLETAWGGLWGALPGILMVVLLLSIAVGESVIWRHISRFTVR